MPKELIDPRLEAVLEEAFIAGFIARDAVEVAVTQLPELAHA